ncbi:hypothetical protein LguiA_017147 [Lonicera macranthoides]
MNSNSHSLNASTSTPSSTQNLPQTFESQAQPQTQVQVEEVDDSVESGTKGGRSWVWAHVKRVKRIINDKEYTYHAICNYCKGECPADPVKNGTSSITYHLKKVCKDSPIYVKTDKTQSVLTKDTMGGGMGTHTFNQKKLELMVFMFVIKDEQPFRVVEGSGYIAMMKEAESRFKIPSRKKVAEGVWDLFVLEKSKIFEAIRDQRVSITTDTWTSIQNINYMVVTSHFMDSDWKLHKRIINFTKITSHKGEDIGRILEVCLNNWGIDKIFSITVDNASANDGAVDYMKRRLKEMNTLLVSGKYLHLRCACHILNLIVKSGLKELASSVEGIRNCVKYIHSLGARLDKFRDFAILFKMDKMSNVPMDVGTRWNSTYKMLDVAYKYRKVFSRMSEENVQFRDYFEELEKDANKNLVKRVGPPVESDWEKALAFVHFLKKFYDSTLKLSATKTVTSSLIWEEMVSLQLETETKMGDFSNPTLQRVATSMKMKFDKYWGDWENVNPLIFLGQVLNPCYKLQMLKINLKELGGYQSKIEMMVREIKVCLFDLYNEYKGGSPIDCRREIVLQNEDAMLESCGGDLNRLKMLKALVQERREQQLHEISNEVDKYFAAPFENPLSGEFDLLKWWKGNTINFPILSKIAKDIFAIPTSTVASENAFSLGRRVVDPFRASLTPKMVEALVCTSDWLRAEEFNFYKEPTDEMLQFYKEMEDVESSVTSQSSASSMPPPRASLSKN